jgi:hypothetical protein
MQSTGKATYFASKLLVGVQGISDRQSGLNCGEETDDTEREDQPELQTR